MSERTNIDHLHDKWTKERPRYAEAYAETEADFQIIKLLIAARLAAGLTQDQLAQRIHTKQAAIARLESGRVNPTMRMVARIAEATGNRLEINLRPSMVAA